MPGLSASDCQYGKGAGYDPPTGSDAIEDGIAVIEAQIAKDLLSSALVRWESAYTAIASVRQLPAAVSM
jgi:hypothetical protein